MGNILESWSAAAAALGVELRGPFKVAFGQNVIEAPMLVPHFGAPKGTVVFTEHQPLENYAALRANGYTASTFSPSAGPDDATEASLIEVLNDWGWCGPDELRPSWAD
ncbi:MAG: hypothetical protein ABIQ32_02785 [Sphingomicrobium sp.]